MKKLKVIERIALPLLLVALVFVSTMRLRLPDALQESPAIEEEAAAESPEPAQTPAPTPTPTPAPTPTPTPTPEPEPEIFTISVIGDCTLTSHQNLAPTSPYSYAGRMGDDYSYPFSNTVEYFANDDFTISNLECNFTDEQLYSPQTFYFRTPTAYANILIEGGVDFVTTANNHMMDFYEKGRDSTYATLEEYQIPYGKEGEAQLYTTESGLVLGIYCDFNGYVPKTEKCVEAINSLKEQGAEYIICAFHWGEELKYRPNNNQINLAHACIDAGADLIYGSHTHCLQPIEEYGDGLILYSMGNWTFGGNTTPSDPDTAIVQVRVKRDLDGTISRDGYDIIPCCISSLIDEAAVKAQSYNDYKPTPYPEGSELYERAMSKITGEYQGPDGNADYSQWHQSWG